MDDAHISIILRLSDDASALFRIKPNVFHLVCRRNPFNPLPVRTGMEEKLKSLCSNAPSLPLGVHAEAAQKIPPLPAAFPGNGADRGRTTADHVFRCPRNGLLHLLPRPTIPGGIPHTGQNHRKTPRHRFPPAARHPPTSPCETSLPCLVLQLKNRVPPHIRSSTRYTPVRISRSTRARRSSRRCKWPPGSRKRRRPARA